MLLIVSTCSAWKETLRWRSLCWQAGPTLPLFRLLVQWLNVPNSHQFTRNWSITTAHRLRERGNSVSSDCAHVQYTLEELLLLRNTSLASSSVCHTHIPMVGDSCFMLPSQLSWYKCRQVCRWKITQKTLYPAQHFILDQWQDNHRLTNRAPGGHLQGVYNCDSH